MRVLKILVDSGYYLLKRDKDELNTSAALMNSRYGNLKKIPAEQYSSGSIRLLLDKMKAARTREADANGREIHLRSASGRKRCTQRFSKTDLVINELAPVL